MRIENGHVYFWGGKFSNFFGVSIDYALCAEMRPVRFNCSEQIFMAHKALYFGDMDALNRIMQSFVPRDQKAIGRTVKGFDQDEWMNVAYNFMLRAVRAKFTQDAKLNEDLYSLSTYTFVEASPKDCIWGVGLAEDDNAILDKTNWKGLNLLGKVLDEVATEILRKKIIVQAETTKLKLEHLGEVCYERRIG